MVQRGTAVPGSIGCLAGHRDHCQLEVRLASSAYSRWQGRGMQVAVLRRLTSANWEHADSIQEIVLIQHSPICVGYVFEFRGSNTMTFQDDMADGCQRFSA